MTTNLIAWQNQRQKRQIHQANIWQKAEQCVQKGLWFQAIHSIHPLLFETPPKSSECSQLVLYQHSSICMHPLEDPCIIPWRRRRLGFDSPTALCITSLSRRSEHGINFLASLLSPGRVSNKAWSTLVVKCGPIGNKWIDAITIIHVQKGTSCINLPCTKT